MSIPEIRAESINLNGQLKVRFIVERDGKLLDIDELNVGNARVREKWAERVAPMVRCDVAELLNVGLQKAAEAMDAATAEDQAANEGDDPRAAALKDTPDDVLEEADAILRDPDPLKLIIDDFAKSGVAGEVALLKLLYLTATSRVLDKPMAVHVRGASSGGKSYVINKVASFMPEEDVVRAHDFTAQSLYYMVPGSLQHKLVVSGERVRENSHQDTAIMGSKAFREMIADGELRKCVTIKGPDGQMVTRVIEQKGPIAFLESSTAGEIHDEDLTRMLVVTVNEGPEQTASVFKSIHDDLAGQSPRREERARICLVQKTVQRLLDPSIEVVIPFAHLLKLPTDRVASRRTIHHMGSALKVIAFLRQKRKKIHQRDNGVRFVRADAEDYRIFLEIVPHVVADALDPLNTLARATLASISERFGLESFTRLQLAGALGVSEPQAGRRVAPLVERGIVIREKRGCTNHYTRTEFPVSKMTALQLPDVEEVARRLVTMDRETDVEAASSSSDSAHAKGKSGDDNELGVHFAHARNTHDHAQDADGDESTVQPTGSKQSFLPGLW